jgi:hypothetical protein
MQANKLKITNQLQLEINIAKKATPVLTNHKSMVYSQDLIIYSSHMILMT